MISSQILVDDSSHEAISLKFRGAVLYAVPHFFAQSFPDFHILEDLNLVVDVCFHD